MPQFRSDGHTIRNGLITVGRRYTEASVFNNAGVTPGVTPGYTGTPGITGVARTDVDGTTEAAFLITHQFLVDGANSAEALSQHATFGGGGAGTASNPYIFKNAALRNFSVGNGDATPAISWDHDATTYPAEVYWIRFENIEFGVAGSTQGNPAGNIRVDAPTGGGALLLNCNFYTNASFEATRSNIIAVRGTTEIRLCRWTRSHHGCVYKTGANAIVRGYDLQIDRTAGAWANSIDMFWNTVAGGSLYLDRVSVDHQTNNPFIRPQRDWAVEINKVDWNTSDNATVGGFIFTTTGYISEPWIAGFTMRDCRLRSGSAANPFIGWGTPNDNQTTNNLLIDHCQFIAGGVDMLGARMIALGDANSGASGTCDNVVFTWCRFARPQATGLVAGNEVLMLFQCSDVEVGYCWVDSCGEDAYEIVNPWDNCHVHHCGGGYVGGSVIGGNMVDFYGSTIVWTNSTNCSAHHIWGTCDGDAVVIDSCYNVLVHDIDVNNVVGAFVQNPPAGNVRLHARGASPMNGVVVSLPLTAAFESFNSIPCMLTYEDVGTQTLCVATPGTVVWLEWNGTGFDTRGGADGVVDAM